MFGVAFGECELICYSIKSNGHIQGYVAVSLQGEIIIGKKVFKVSSDLLFGITPADAILIDDRYEIAMERDGDHTFYIAHWDAERKVFKTSERRQMAASWIAGTSASDRWSEPLFEYSDVGIQYDI